MKIHNVRLASSRTSLLRSEKDIELFHGDVLHLLGLHRHCTSVENRFALGPFLLRGRSRQSNAVNREGFLCLPVERARPLRDSLRHVEM